MFKVGDVVRLKSGGQKMTITALLDKPQPDTVRVGYWNSGFVFGVGPIRLEYRDFPPDCLELGDPPQKTAAVAIGTFVAVDVPREELIKQLKKAEDRIKLLEEQQCRDAKAVEKLLAERDKLSHDKADLQQMNARQAKRLVTVRQALDGCKDE